MIGAIPSWPLDSMVPSTDPGLLCAAMSTFCFPSLYHLNGATPLRSLLWSVRFDIDWMHIVIYDVSTDDKIKIWHFQNSGIVRVSKAHPNCVQHVALQLECNTVQRHSSHNRLRDLPREIIRPKTLHHSWLDLLYHVLHGTLRRHYLYIRPLLSCLGQLEEVNAMVVRNVNIREALGGAKLLLNSRRSGH